MPLSPEVLRRSKLDALKAKGWSNLSDEEKAQARRLMRRDPFDERAWTTYPEETSFPMESLEERNKRLVKGGPTFSPRRLPRREVGQEQMLRRKAAKTMRRRE